MKGIRVGAGQIGMLVLFMIVGAIIGSLIGEALSPVVPVMKLNKEVELGPAHINLVSFSFTVGLGIKLNLAGAAGMVAGIFLYRRF
ncbi:DUF4321 domain-containing protein [Heliobacterium gestii]|uniref:DUF4321 domain-containing protein n=1 Tax=Heliomicrobium gestii TaxID=2699 RepID=A0A845L6H0_HELGE|nr:DUF4321 domain-containing protein [Heliomicrobium gestii]MBM7866838.1 hypothetical protein [Heliomicrobium gestii]MZP42267.1 DUF4321 domain-containing protein [Heliomicrobium gestii]